MCGIMGYSGPRFPLPLLVSGLERLEYRGYDSSGVAFFNSSGVIDVLRAAGKVSLLKERVGVLEGHPGAAIGHIRWATHGGATLENAHPHQSGPIVLVHNGIIENEQSLREQLRSQGVVFHSETDTEVLAHLIRLEYERTGAFAESVQKALTQVEGSYALAILCQDAPADLVVVRQGPPLILGMGEGECFVASDIPAFLHFTRQIYVFRSGEIGLIRHGDVRVGELSSPPSSWKTPSSQTISWDPFFAEKGNYRHFMEKEIFEGSRALMDTLADRIAPGSLLPELAPFAPFPPPFITFVACGTSWHAALLGRYFMESMGISCAVEIASEFRYRPLLVPKGGWVIGISQSGETADTLGALDLARRAGYRTLGISNVPGSSMERETDLCLLTHAGPEIGVASTKAFQSQVAILMLLSLALSGRDADPEQLESLIRSPHRLEMFLETLSQEKFDTVVERLRQSRLVMFAGRGVDYPLSLEGALKFKEITYRPADGYPAGELKHGPIALVEPGVTVIAPMVEMGLRQKEISNLREIRARGGYVLAIGPSIPDSGNGIWYDDRIELPDGPVWSGVFQAAAVLQYLSYRVAVSLGNDVDQPRNLAKSVTVE
ncbi:MAG: glutamine--fructose-6-phosphate transaminase (isomerizing) [Leptospirales bacterium]